MKTTRPEPKPLTVREAALCDFTHFYMRMLDAHPDETIGQTRARFSNMLSYLRDPDKAPAGLRPRELFPVLVGLYPNVVRHPDAAVVAQLAEAAADLLAMAVMCGDSRVEEDRREKGSGDDDGPAFGFYQRPGEA